MSLPATEPEPLTGLPYSQNRRCNGFSLVEVTISIAIIAFAFIAIIGMLPAGMATYSKSTANAAATQIYAKVVSDIRQTDFSKFVYPDGAQTSSTTATIYTKHPVRYFDDLGDEITPQTGTTLNPKELARVVYHVYTRVLTNAPVLSDQSNRNAQFLATITIQIATNPANENLTLSSDGFVQVPPGMQLRNYTFQFAKND